MGYCSCDFRSYVKFGENLRENRGRYDDRTESEEAEVPKRWTANMSPFLETYHIERYLFSPATYRWAMMKSVR
jgi:hypothetical protein